MQKKDNYRLILAGIVIICLIFNLLGFCLLKKDICKASELSQSCLEVINGINSAVYGAEDELAESDELTSESLGTYKITHYCTCTKCTRGSGITASGTVPVEGRTCAAEGLPIGTKLLIAETGEILTVEDRFGDPSKTNCLDIYVASHDEALKRGTFLSEVYILYY